MEKLAQYIDHTLSNVYNDEDYRKTGRTLDKMGFNHWTKNEILEFLGV